MRLDLTVPACLCASWQVPDETLWGRGGREGNKFTSPDAQGRPGSGGTEPAAAGSPRPRDRPWASCLGCGDHAAASPSFVALQDSLLSPALLPFLPAYPWAPSTKGCNLISGSETKDPSPTSAREAPGPLTTCQLALQGSESETEAPAEPSMPLPMGLVQVWGAGDVDAG